MASQMPFFFEVVLRGALDLFVSLISFHSAAPWQFPHGGNLFPVPCVHSCQQQADLYIPALVALLPVFGIGSSPSNSLFGKNLQTL
jgi:hypothetical protein